MKAKTINWIKGHKRVVSVSMALVMLMVLCLSMLPVYAADPQTYLDVTGSYDVSSRATPRYTNYTRHNPSVAFGQLIITTQSGKVITDATLEHMGADIALTGLVGPGTKPTIVLSGTDSDGTNVVVEAKVTSNSAGEVTSLKGRIMGYVTSDGYRFEDSADGTTAISVVTQYSGAISILLTAGTLASPETILFHRPVNKMKLKDLDTLATGKLGFRFNLQDTKSPGPQMMLRFAPAGSTDQAYWAAGTEGGVDITLMPYQAPYTGDGTWKQCSITKDTISCVYYGLDPTDYTAFDGGGAGVKLSEIEALINAEAAMTAGGDSCSEWVLTMVDVELWEGGARTCYVDDVLIDGKTYTMEPNSYYNAFKAKPSS